MKAPAKDVVRIGGGNVYVNNPAPAKAVGVAVGTRSHSFFFSEGANLPEHLRARKGIRPLLPLDGFTEMRDARDCVGFVRPRLNLRHHSFTRVSAEVPGSKVGQSRTFAMVSYEAPMLAPGAKHVPVVTHIGIHPNWIVGIDSKASVVARQHAVSAERLDAMLTLAEAIGDFVVVTGDYNVGRHQEKPLTTVLDVLDARGLVTKMDGIDGASWSPGLVLDDWTLIPKVRTKTDHDNWTVVDLRRKGRRRA